MDDCPFCQILAGNQPANMLYEDAETAAFLDNNPAATGHSLVVPTTHRERLFTRDAPVPLTIFDTVNKIAMAIDRALDPAGFSLFYTAGPLVGSISHAHVHLVPRYEGDAIQLALSRSPLDQTTGSQLASRIRDQLPADE